MAHLTLVPCNHYWLAVHYGQHLVIAICKHCKKRSQFTKDDWALAKQYGIALDKPVRV